ncbi:MAG: T9SS type A sorting domain-containing protein [Bacteroidota bacterium]
MMRKLLLLALACAPIFLMAQAQRIALVEHFTNASCGPCAVQNPDFNALLRANPDKVISIKYQAAFPGFDPMNQQNPSEVQTRANFYGLSGVPTAWLDGFTGDDSYGGGIGAWDIAGGGYAGGPYGHNQAVIDYASDQSTPISMVVTHTLNEDVTEVSVTVAITNESGEDFTMADGRLQVALVERDIIYPAAPGSNGELHFEEVMRKMYPDAEGTTMATIAAGETWETTITGAIPDYIYGLNEMRVIAFVQDHSTQEIWQAAYTEPAEIANGVDGSIGGNLTADPVGLCGASITPIVEFGNNGSVDITQAVVAASINDVVVETMEFTGTLAPGETADITFSELVLAEANNALSFSLLEVNSGMGINLNTLNDQSLTTVYGALSETPIGTELEEDNESYDLTYPETGLVIPSIALGEFGGNSFIVYDGTQLPAQNDDGSAIGGYGLSDRSIFINFYQWNPSGATPDDASLTYQKIDLSGAVAPALVFDRASASYSLDGVSGDRLRIQVSTDCAATFTTIWDGSGNSLNTTVGHEPYFVPNADEWVTETIELSDYIGEEINVRFLATSAWGNNLFLDNINISDIVGTQELTEVSEISMFPNPANEMLRVDFNLEQASQLQVEVFNATGQRVQQLGAENYNTGRNQLSLDVSQFANGVYFLRMFNADRELNRRFIVQH